MRRRKTTTSETTNCRSCAPFPTYKDSSSTFASAYNTSYTVGARGVEGEKPGQENSLRRAGRRAGVLRERVVLAADHAAGLGRVRRDPGAVLFVVALLVPNARVRARRAARRRAAVPGADVVLALDVAARGPLGHPRAVLRGLVLLVPRRVVRARDEDLGYRRAWRQSPCIAPPRKSSSS